MLNRVAYCDECGDLITNIKKIKRSRSLEILLARKVGIIRLYLLETFLRRVLLDGLFFCSIECQDKFARYYGFKRLRKKG